MSGTRVYPRVCGGTGGAAVPDLPIIGLSPRVRGNLGIIVGYGGDRRSIPACAGEPTSAAGALLRGRVYPRVCGGTRLKNWDGAVYAGLSPRVRGNLRR